MNAGLDLPEQVAKLVSDIGARISSVDIDVWDRLRGVEDRSLRERTSISEWAAQQSHERSLRKAYAGWLLVALFGQVVVVDVAFFLIGSGRISVEQWVASAFVAGAFVQVTGLVAAVLRFLFPSASTMASSRRSDGPRNPS